MLKQAFLGAASIGLAMQDTAVTAQQEKPTKAPQKRKTKKVKSHYVEDHEMHKAKAVAKRARKGAKAQAIQDRQNNG